MITFVIHGCQHLKLLSFFAYTFFIFCSLVRIFTKYNLKTSVKKKEVKLAIMIDKKGKKSIIIDKKNYRFF